MRGVDVREMRRDFIFHDDGDEVFEMWRDRNTEGLWNESENDNHRNSLSILHRSFFQSLFSSNSEKSQKTMKRNTTGETTWRDDRNHRSGRKK